MVLELFFRPIIHEHQAPLNPTLILLTHSNPWAYTLYINTLRHSGNAIRTVSMSGMMECVWNLTSPQILVLHLGHFPLLQDFSFRGRGRCKQFSSAVGWPERLTQVTLRRLKPFPHEVEHYVETKREKERKPCKETISHADKNCAGWLELRVARDTDKRSCDLVERI